MSAEAPAPRPGQALAPDAVRRALAAIARVESAAAVTGLSVSALLIVVDVVVREGVVPLAKIVGLNASAWLPHGLSRYALYGVLVSAFAGFAASSASGTHLGSGLGQMPLPAALARHRARVGHALTGLVFAAAAWYAGRFVWSSGVSGIRAAFLAWPAWPLQAVMPVALGLSALHYLSFAAWPSLRAGASGET